MPTPKAVGDGALTGTNGGRVDSHSLIVRTDMPSEGTTRHQTIKERTAKLQQEAAALQAQIVQHLGQRPTESFRDSSLDGEQDELTA